MALLWVLNMSDGSVAYSKLPSELDSPSDSIEEAAPELESAGLLRLGTPNRAH